MAVIKIVPMPGVGVPGPQGQAGQAGQSAYQVAVSNGFVGTEQEWLDSLGGGNADIADFVFASDGEESTMTVANHDMMIRTTRTGNQDADISIDSSDDVWITANDEVEISSTNNTVAIFTSDFNKKWSFNPNGSLSLPSGSSTDISHASIGAGTSGNIVLETRTATFTSDYQNSTNIFNGSGLYLTINEDSLWIAANANGNITVTFADNTTAQVEQVYDGTSQSIPAMVFGLADSVNKSFEDTFPLTIVAEKVVPKNYVSINSNEATWKFEGDDSLVLPHNIKLKDNASTQTNIEAKTLIAFADYLGNTAGTSTQITVAANETSLWMANAWGNVTEFGANITMGNSIDYYVTNIYASNIDGTDVVTIVYADTPTEFDFPIALVMSASINSYNKNFKISMQDQQEDGNVEWTFSNDGTLTTPVANATILNPAVPGNITLSAYSGVELSFADVPGAGLTFPDQTIQTTAYTGGDTASHGDFYFDQSTLRVDASGDMILEANEGDGTVASQIKVGKGDVPINIAAYDRQENWFNTADWSTAEWQINSGGGGQIVLTGIISIEQHLNNFNADFQKILINDATLAVFNGASYGGGNATIYVSEAPTETATITSLRFIQSIRSGMMVDLDNGNMEIISSNMSMDITTTGGNDIVLRSSDDLDLRAEDDIRFYANTDATQQSWTMDSEGLFHLPGDGYISNPVDSSGDGNGYDTLKIVPDQSRESYDQYLIIDPTQPNHIHIRAGGTQDASNAELILGAEENHVAVNDSADSVTIKTKRDDSVWTYQNVNSGGTTFIVNLENSEPDYGDFLIDNDIKYTINYVFRNLETYSTEYTAAAPDGTLLEFAPWTFYTFFRDNGSSYWQFNNQGYLSGPAMGNVNVYGITNPSTSTYLGIYSSHKISISGTDGEFLGDAEVASNQIATIGDLPTGATGSFVSQDGKTIIVTNGIITGII